MSKVFIRKTMLIALLALASCGGMNSTQKSTISGAAGNAVATTTAGAIGAGTGYVYGNNR